MINKNLYILNEIPFFYPDSIEYIEFWKTEKRRCIEGYWIGGVYMTPHLYFYANHWHIKLNDKQQTLSRPRADDLEWEKSYIYLVAKGFSGFSNDTKFTCNELYKESGKDENGRVYIEPLEYLKKTHEGNLGKPLYENNCKNVIDIEARYSGKSYWMSCLIGHHFLFDGVLDYDEYLRLKNSDEEIKISSGTTVGAIDAKYSSDLLSKVEIGFDNLRGKIKIGNEVHPAPFYKNYAGSWQVSKEIEAITQIRTTAGWQNEGTGTIINHVTFKDNPFAANGKRGNLVVLEEIGFFNNLKDSFGQVKYLVGNGVTQNGVIYMTGTGGDMKGGSTRDAQDVFYDPESYNCMAFPDIWENSGKIGYFVPCYIAKREYKDDDGKTNLDLAIRNTTKIRENASKSKDRNVYDNLVQQEPTVPSEAFLNIKYSMLPITSIRDRLKKIKSEKKTNPKGVKGILKLEPNGKVKFEVDLENKLSEAEYPVKKGMNNSGCIVIYEPPDNPVYSKYIAGTDPLQQDATEESESLCSVFILKRSSLATVEGEDGKDTVVGLDGDVIVAEYTGKKSTLKETNEQVRLLCIFYEAINLYENQFINLKEHFDTKGSMIYLMRTPRWLKASVSLVRQYGLNMTEDIKEELEIYARDWLLEENSRGGINLDHIESEWLLEELLAYGKGVNTDRVIAFFLVLVANIELKKIRYQENQKKAKDNFFNQKFFVSTKI